MGGWRTHVCTVITVVPPRCPEFSGTRRTRILVRESLDLHFATGHISLWGPVHEILSASALSVATVYTIVYKRETYRLTLASMHAECQSGRTGVLRVVTPERSPTTCSRL